MGRALPAVPPKLCKRTTFALLSRGAPLLIAAKPGFESNPWGRPAYLTRAAPCSAIKNFVAEPLSDRAGAVSSPRQENIVFIIG